jgi:hypothetical protein
VICFWMRRRCWRAFYRGLRRFGELGVERRWCRVCRMFGLAREVWEMDRMLLLLILRAVWVLGLKIGVVVEEGR